MFNDLNSLEQAPAPLIACSIGFILVKPRCKGGIIAIKIDNNAAYIGTVINELILFRIALVRVVVFVANSFKRLLDVLDMSERGRWPV